MTSTIITPAIMCGGAGTRLWPVSRKRLPKQFLPIVGGIPLLEATLARMANAGEPFGRTIVVASHDHEFLVRRAAESSNMGDSVGIYEPEGRGTAAAIWAIAMRALELADDSLILIMPSDHYIPDAEGFRQTIREGLPAAQDGNWVTFGVSPTDPSTAYGYIEAGEPLGAGTLKVTGFIEKPDAETALQLLASGSHYWNAGIFLVRARTAMDAIAKHAPDIDASMRKVWQASLMRGDSLYLDAETMGDVRSDSIDYAVLEHETNIAMVPFSGTWSDVGSWSAVAELSDTDASGNAALGNVEFSATTNTYVQAGKRLIATVGVSDLIIVDTDDATLVCERSQAENIKDLIAALRISNAEKLDEHKSESRPWGRFERIFEGDNYQVKCLEVTPGGRLSLQYHHHRSEHWVVVRGTPTVTVGDDVRVMEPGQSVDVPQGAIHRLENFGDETVQIIEIQRGDYLGEDDIIRVEDTYDRPAIPRK